MNRCRYCGAVQTQFQFNKGSNGWTNTGAPDMFDCGTCFDSVDGQYSNRRGIDCYERELDDTRNVLNGKVKEIANWSAHCELLEKACEKYREELRED